MREVGGEKITRPSKGGDRARDTRRMVSAGCPPPHHLARLQRGQAQNRDGCPGSPLPVSWQFVKHQGCSRDATYPVVVSQPGCGMSASDVPQPGWMRARQDDARRALRAT